MKQPVVSVCIPTYNGAAHLAAALESVLCQTLPDLELLISDDGSDDDSARIAHLASDRDARVRVLAHGDHVGAAANWQRTVDAARGEFVKIMGQDDLLDPECLARQVDALRADPAAGMVVAGRRLIDERGSTIHSGRRPLGGARGRVGRDVLLRRVVASGTNPLGEPVAFLLRRSLLAEAGQFRTDLPYVVDLEYWCRAARFASLTVIPESLCAFRVSSHAWSARLASDQARQATELFRELRQMHPGAISRADLAQGAVKAWILAVLRRLLYVWLARHRPLSG